VRGTGAQHTENGRVVSVSGVESRSHITLETTGIVAQSTIWSSLGSDKSSNGTQVDGHISKRTGSDISTSDTGSKLDVASRDTSRWNNDRSVVWDIVTVSAKTVWIAIEDWRVLWC
jgi:hypothetical protein